ncbi:FtsX-like permease family protein [Streptomyces sp. NPDC059816]|uniref:ABC transporter permease n=1 Tax=Streptomyces sp. NPDC059816 TaxID=3346960 RepID=UPI0036503ED9
MRALGRWALADLRTHRGRAATLTLATAGVMAALLLSAALLQFAASPWQQVFTQTRGNHVWLRLDSGADTRPLSDLPGVESVSGPYGTVPVTARSATARAALELRSVRPDGPTGRERRFLSGRWLSGAPGEAVLDRATAEALWVRPGDDLRIRAAGAPPGVLRVVGVMTSSEAGYTGDARAQRPGTAWTAAGTAARYAAGDAPGRTVGLRLADGTDTDFVVQQAVAVAGPEHVVRVSTWREARAAAAAEHRLSGRLLRGFGVGSLVAAALAVTGGVSGRVRGQVRDIAVLKVIGMTPRQVAVMFVAQHAALALVGVVLGGLLVRTVGSRVPGPLGEAVSYGVALPSSVPGAGAIGAVTVGVIAAATALSAWRAARVPPSPMARAARPRARRMSRSARRALRWGVPPHLVLGWRGATHRGARFTGSVVRLAVPIMMITVALAALSTLEALRSGSGGRVNPAPPLTVRPGAAGPAPGQVARIADDSRVRAVYPAAEVTALIPGQTRSVTLRGLGTAAHAYPFVAVEGRAPRAPHEAVAGQGLLDATGTGVGDWVRLTVGGTPHILHVVGRSIEPEHNGQVITTTLDTLRAGGTAGAPQSYAVLLHPGADPDAVARSLRAALPGADVRRAPSAPAPTELVTGVLGGLIGVLGLIAVVELAGSVSAAARHHGRELPALRGLGLTPRQLVGVIVTHCAVTAVAATAVGIALGLLLARPLIDAEGHGSGVGAGIAVLPAVPWLALGAAGPVLMAVALALVPAVRAQRRRAPDPTAAPG